MALDPFRNADQDIRDALEMADVGFGTDPNTQFTYQRQDLVPVVKVLTYDDYSSWGEWEPGELAELEDWELRDELVSFRGEAWADKALGWLDFGIPAVIVLDGLPEHLSEDVVVGVGDGRGRLSFAVGMNIEHVPVIWVRPKAAINKLKTKLLEMV